MNSVKFLLAKDDSEMRSDLEKTFGEDLTITEEYDFIGDTIIIYAVPLTALGLQIVDFILTHIIDKSDNISKMTQEKKEKRKIIEKRIIEIDGERISLKEYTVDEMKTILYKKGVYK